MRVVFLLGPTAIRLPELYVEIQRAIILWT